YTYTHWAPGACPCRASCPHSHSVTHFHTQHRREHISLVTLVSLPRIPPYCTGFSELVVPRPPYWPHSVTACGFWQPPLEWFAGQQLPTDLAEVLGSAVAPAAADMTTPAVRSPLMAPPLSTTEPGLCLVDFGSCGRMGFIPAPLDTLTLLDAVLRRLDMWVSYRLSPGYVVHHAIPKPHS
ncbi:hypothetical protein Vafri_16300, partial [Volvox africanus]